MKKTQNNYYFTQNDHEYAQKGAFCVIRLLWPISELQNLLPLAEFIVCVLCQYLGNNISFLDTHVCNLQSLIELNVILMVISQTGIN